MSTFVSNHPTGQKERNLPPGPRGHFLWGILPELGRDPLAQMNKMFREYGDAVRFKALLHFYGYFFSHPDHNKHILQDNNKNYTKQPHPTMQILSLVLGNGLLTSDGDFWMRQRRLAQPAFHRRRIHNFGETMVTATERMLAAWDQKAGGSELDLDHEMMQLTLEIVGRTLFSIDITREADKVGAAFSVVNEQISQLSAQPFSEYWLRIPFLPPSRRLNRHVAQLDDVVHKIINQRRGVPQADMPDDLLTMLMLARDEETGEGMNDRQLRDEVMTILLAGHETTAVALTWTFYLLSQHPAALAKLEAELDDVLNGRSPTMADMPDLAYTKMVVEEAMRLYPPAYAIARYGHEADVVGGWDVTPGAIIALSPYLTHRHPDFWDDPETFDPERFTPQRVAARPRYAYLPFGGGPRQCIGSNFAMTEAILLLATIAGRYRLALAPGHHVSTEPLITLRPKGGMPMRLTRR